MVLKTFNLEEETYKKFSKYCKEKGISMSKQVDLFIKAQLEIIKNEEKRLDEEKKKLARRGEKRVIKRPVINMEGFIERHLS
jgi:hypothetical protein